MSLNSVNIGQNKYCGPAVLSILTGKSTDECARVISSINGKYTIEGVELKHLLLAAERLGFDSEGINPAANLYGTLVSLAPRDGVYIVTITGHFVVIEVKDKKIYFCDNHTKEPMPAAASARMMQACKAVHKVVKRREPMLVKSKVTAKKTLTMDEGYCTVVITEQITYDIEKYNKTNTIGWVRFNTEADFNEFVEGLTNG
jgi:ABC-type bacteriocin/lantibiotic exporter with double-glycine peptidase domain